MIKRAPDGYVGKVNHEIPRKPRVDVWKPIAENVEFDEFDAGIFAAVVNDEIRDNVGPDVFEVGRPLDVSHPVKVAAWRVKQAADRMAAYKFGKFCPDRHCPLQLGPPAAATLTVVPPVLPENIREDLFRVVGPKAVYRHSLVDDGAQPAWRVVSDRGVKARRMALQQ